MSKRRRRPGQSGGGGKARKILAQAVKAHEAGRRAEAATLYRKVLSAEPENADALHLLGVAAYQSRDLETAVSLISRAISLSPRAHYFTNLGNALMDQGSVGKALSTFKEALALDPEQTEARNNLAVALRKLGRLDEAEAAFSGLGGAGAQVIYNRGNLLLDQGRLDEAEAAYRSALEIDPEHANSNNNLGSILLGRGDPEGATTYFRRAFRADPGHGEAFGNMGAALLAQGRAKIALGYFRKAIEIRPDNLEAHHNLGAACLESGDPTEALACYRRVLELDPSREDARHMAAALTGETPESAPASYVRGLFDDYSATFEKHLVEDLGYAAPNDLRRALDGIAPEGTFDNVLDLGCGGGLSGLAFRDRAVRLTGIDLSPGMIREARGKKCYDRLETVDLLAFLEGVEERFDLFVATDVFTYVGELAPLFRSVRERAVLGAFFLFSTEVLDGEGFRLGSFGRYAHSRSYIEALAAAEGFRIAGREETSIRKHRGRWLPGELYLLRVPPLH